MVVRLAVIATVLAVVSGCTGEAGAGVPETGDASDTQAGGHSATGGDTGDPDGEPSSAGGAGGTRAPGGAGRGGMAGGAAGDGHVGAGTSGGGDTDAGAAGGGAGMAGGAGDDGAGSGGEGGSGEPPVGDLIFVGDWETGDVSQFDGTSQCEPGRILVYSDADAPADAPSPRQGAFAARFRVHDTDVAPCTPNATPRTNAYKLGLFMEGDEIWQAWSVYVPAAVANAPDGWMVIEEDYGPPFAGPPAVGWAILFYDAPVFAMDTEGSTQWSTPLMTDRWIDYLVHKRFSQSAASGFVEAWVDGQPLTFSGCGGCTQLPLATMSAGQTLLDLIMLQYRAIDASGAGDFMDIYFDDVRIGTTRDVVELQ